MNPNDTKTTSAKVHGKKPENLERVVLEFGIFMRRQAYRGLDALDSYGSQGTYCGHCRESADSVEQRNATPVEEVQASTLHCECCGLATATHRATLDCALCDRCVAMLVGIVKRTLEASG